jgi:hypothetical protein
MNRAAKIFITSLPTTLFPHIHTLKVSLHGSLAATGLGHMTPHSVLLGLMGEDPVSVEVGRLGVVMDEVKAVGEVLLGVGEGGKRVKFDVNKDLVSPPRISYPTRIRGDEGLIIDMAFEPITCSSEWGSIHRIQRPGRHASY